MKRIISVLMLVCLMASFCTLSAFALPFGAVEVTSDISIVNDGGTEKIVFGLKANYDIPNCVIKVKGVEADISETKPVGGTLAAGEHSCEVVIAGTGSTDWETTIIDAKDGNYPVWVDLYSDGNLIGRMTGTEADLTAQEKETFNNFSGTEYRLFTWVTDPEIHTGSREAYGVIFFSLHDIKDLKAVVYSDDKVLASTVPTSKYIVNGALPKGEWSISMRLNGSESSSWTTTIGNIVKGDYPDKLELYSGSELIYTSDVSWTDEQKATFDSTEFAQNLPEVPFDLQGAVDSAENNSSDPTVVLPENVTVSEPIKVSENVSIVLADSVFDNDITKTFDGNLSELAPGAIVTISNVEGKPEELKLMRELVDEDYCVSKGSIVVKASHNLGSDGKCKDCDVQVVPNPYSVPATADNSNMPLWTALFIAFAAVALLTGKKKKA